jgi:hypothetical protein
MRFAPFLEQEKRINYFSGSFRWKNMFVEAVSEPPCGQSKTAKGEMFLPIPGKLALLRDPPRPTGWRVGG